MSTRTQATIDDLYHVEEDGKAEIVDGELVLMSPTGDLPGSAALEIAVSLRTYAQETELMATLSASSSTSLTADRLARTPLSMSVRVLAESFSKARRSSPPR